MESPSIDARILASLRIAAARGRETERIGPFLATFTTADPNPYLNYALPDDGAEPTRHDVLGLIAAYRVRGRRARLEYPTSCAPLLELALLTSGFVPEGRLALMVPGPDGPADPPLPDGVSLVAPTTDADLLGLLTVQNEAYGGSGAPTEEDAHRLRASLAVGDRAILARDGDPGEAVGAGQVGAAAEGIAEVTGVAVRAPWRRRGIAGAIVARLTREALVDGVELPFLMAFESASRAYERAGYRTISDILHIALPG